MSYAHVGVDLRTHARGVVVAAGQTEVVLGPFVLARFPRHTWTIYNQGPGALSTVTVQANPDPGGREDALPGANPDDVGRGPSGSLWETIGTLSNVGAGSVQSIYVADKVHRWWRLVATAGGLSNTTVSGYVSAVTI